MSVTAGHLRWYAKKAARKSIALGSWSSGSLRVQSANGSRCIRVLTYHRFGSEPHDPFCVDVDTFDAQMHVLATLGLAVSLADVELFLAGGCDLADGSVLVTVDDGFRSVYTDALPVLKTYSIPAVAYVPVGCMDGGGIEEPGPEPRLSWDELAELTEHGVSIGSHAWSHRSLGTMSADEVAVEAARSREVLETQLAAQITSFAYPFGTRADFNTTTYAILRESGYATAFTSQHGAITPQSDAHELPRIKVEGGEPLWMFKLLLRGGLDRWRWVDRTLWRLQANHNTL